MSCCTDKVTTIFIIALIECVLCKSYNSIVDLPQFFSRVFEAFMYSMNALHSIQ